MHPPVAPKKAIVGAADVEEDIFVCVWECWRGEVLELCGNFLFGKDIN